MKEGKTKRIKQLKILQNILYIFLVFILVAGMVFQATQCLLKYLEKPTYTKLQIVDQTKAEFPAFTLCHEGLSYKTGILKVTILLN